MAEVNDWGGFLDLNLLLIEEAHHAGFVFDLSANETRAVWIEESRDQAVVNGKLPRLFADDSDFHATSMLRDRNDSTSDVHGTHLLSMATAQAAIIDMQKFVYRN